MDAEEFAQLLFEAAEKVGGGKKWSALNGFPHSYICRVMKGTKPPSERLVNALGYTWVLQKIKPATK